MNDVQHIPPNNQQAITSAGKFKNISDTIIAILQKARWEHWPSTVSNLLNSDFTQSSNISSDSLYDSVNQLTMTLTVGYPSYSHKLYSIKQFRPEQLKRMKALIEKILNRKFNEIGKSASDDLYRTLINFFDLEITNTIYLPAYATTKRHFKILTPGECWKATQNILFSHCNFSEKGKKIKKLEKKLMELLGENILPTSNEDKVVPLTYKKDNLIVYVFDHSDTLMIPFILYLLKQFQNNLEIEFKFGSFWTLSDHLIPGEHHRADIIYGTSGERNETSWTCKESGDYEWGDIFYKKPIPVSLLFPVSLLEKQSGLKSPRPLLVLPFMGNQYADRYDTPIGYQFIKSTDEYLKKNFCDLQSHMFIQFASTGETNDSLIINPTPDGAMWAYTSGLIDRSDKWKNLQYFDFETSKSPLTIFPIENKQNKLKRLSIGIRKTENLEIYKTLNCFQEIVDLMNNYIKDFLNKNDFKRLFSSDVDRLVTAFLSPLLRANPEYDGLLVRMPPEAVLLNIADPHGYINNIQQNRLFKSIDKAVSKPENTLGTS